MMGELEDESTQSTNAHGFDGVPYKIDQSTFTKRLQALYSHWREHKDELWGSADFYTVATPPPTEDIRCLKSSKLNIWLLGYEFPDAIMVFGSKQIHFLCSLKNASLLDSVKLSAKEAVDVDVIMHVMEKGDDGTSVIDDVLRSMRTSKSEDHDAPIVGYIAEESPEGSYLEKWTDKLKNSGLQLFDMTDGLYDIFSVKDPNELSFAKKAAYQTASTMKNFVVSKHKELIDVEKKLTQLSLMDDATEKSAVLDPARMKVKPDADKQEVSKEEELLGDWVVVTNGGPDVITQLWSKDVKDVAYHSFNDTEEVAYFRNDDALYSKSTLLSDKQEVSKEEELVGDWVAVTNGGPDVITKLSSQVDDVRIVSAYTSDDAEEEVEPMLNEFKPIRLSDLQMYPPFDDPGRKMTGALEAHANGFRYSTSEQDDERVVDVMLTNIKHAFFQLQLAEKSKYTLLHFHLHNHMVVGNEKTKDLQFRIEVVDGDSDEIKKNNMNFRNFVNMVHEGLDLEFEQPHFELGFYGEPSDRCTSAFIVPTKSCLVELIGFPFLVITLSEIAIVNLERIYRCFRGWQTINKKIKKEMEKKKKKQNKQRKYFDMAIVFKDMKRDVMVIHGIPPNSLVGIEVWMETTSGGIKYHKSRLNLLWRDILDAFLDDPQVFVDAGGWDFLNEDRDCYSDLGDIELID